MSSFSCEGSYTSSLSKMAAKSRHLADSLIFLSFFPKATESEFVPIVHLYKMSSMESGSLTQKDGGIF